MTEEFTVTYDLHQHTHAIVEGLSFDQRLMEIVHHSGQGDKLRIWLMASYADNVHDTPGLRAVHEDDTDGYDTEGNVIVSVPAASCKFYTDEEAHQIEELQAINAKLLSYAR
jgi:hypothetical protein